MITEAVFWYIVRAVSGIVSIFTAYTVLKYLSKKTLAMKTIFDAIIKEFIYLKILDWLLNVFIDIVINFLSPLDYYVALLIIISRRTIIMAGLFQLIAIMLIRYLYVFHQTLLNNECLVMFMTKLLVAYTALTTTLIAGDFENADDYYLIIGKSKENYGFINSKPNMIVAMIGMIVLIITEYKIIKFKKSVDSRQQFDEIPAAAGEEEGNCICYFKKYSDRIVFGILFVLFLCTFLYSVINNLHLIDLSLRRLRRISFQNTVTQNIIPIILIVRNPKMFYFFKSEIFSILRICKLNKNQIKPAMIELNV